MGVTCINDHRSADAIDATATKGWRNNCALCELERLRDIEAAARNLIAQKGRHNTEIAYRRLVNLVTPNVQGNRPPRTDVTGE